MYFMSNLFLKKVRPYVNIGKKATSNNTNTITNKNGVIPLSTTDILLFVTALATNRFIPNGGVNKPIANATIIIILK